MGSALLGVAAAGIIVQGPGDVWVGLLEIQRHPARLLNDFTLVGGDGAALVNAALVAAIGLFVVRITAVRLSGPTIAAVFTMLGFGLFGKTVVNILPILAGVYISARIARKTYRDYILMALYGTALGPLITALAVEAGMATGPALPVALCGGLAAGILLPPVAMAMLRLHQGYNLYNIGLTAGFIGLFAASLLTAAGRPLSAPVVWNSNPSTMLVLLIPALSTLFLAAALVGGPGRSLREFAAILRLSGRLPTDFVSQVGPSGALLNMALVGYLTWAYVLLVSAPLNGPVLGGILTAFGFASFGKHPRNGWPVMAGVVMATLVFGKDLATAGPVLAALFCLTLAPLAGEFGWKAGVVAGFLHLAMVERTAAWHLGINLYNNGFAGGLTATFMVAIIEWFRTSRETPFTTRVVKAAGKDDTSTIEKGREHETDRVSPAPYK